MDNCGICQKPADQLFETSQDNVYACFKCQPLVPEVTIGDQMAENNANSARMEFEIEIDNKPLQDGDSTDNLYCNLCHKSFQKNAQLQNHIRNHRAERRFLCTYCNKAFSQSNNLKAHLRIHTNERPFKCTECGKAFTQVTNLNNHVRLHTGERPFVCGEPGCDRAFAQVTNLNQHRKRHLSGRPLDDPYVCNVCGQKFAQRNHMNLHKREAHGEAKSEPRQRHVCRICTAVLPTEQKLMLHVQEHTAHGHKDDDDDKDSGESGITCVFSSCGARFSSPSEHTEHLLKAHQLRVVAAKNDDPPPKRGRPPKSESHQMLKDPLGLDPKELAQYMVKEMKETPSFLSNLRLKSLFQ